MAASTQTLLASGAITATGTSSAIQASDHTIGSIIINCTAVSGTSTPTITVTVQDSADGTIWATLDTFTGITATGTSVKRITNFGNYIRLSYVVTGTNPSLTVSAVAVLKTHS